MLPLTGHTLLVTRPQHQADGLIKQLRAAGATTSALPLLAIDTTQVDQQHIKQRVIDIDIYQHIIVISRNAALRLDDWIDQYWPQRPERINWLAVGEATANTLKQLGYPVNQPDTGMNTESLLLLPELQKLSHQRVLICRGVGGRETLAEQLRSRGARVDYVELYTRVPCHYDKQILQQQLLQPPPTAILISSGEGLSNFATQLNKLTTQDAEQIKAIMMLVPSQRVADLATSLGFQQIEIAENATDQAMVEAISKAVSK